VVVVVEHMLEALLVMVVLAAAVMVVSQQIQTYQEAQGLIIPEEVVVAGLLMLPLQELLMAEQAAPVS
jgi:hypothetical protein